MGQRRNFFLIIFLICSLAPLSANVSLMEFIRQWGLDYQWLPFYGEFVLRKGEQEVRISQYTSYLFLNDRSFYEGSSLTYDGKEYWIDAETADFLKDFFLSSSESFLAYDEESRRSSEDGPDQTLLEPEEKQEIPSEADKRTWPGTLIKKGRVAAIIVDAGHGGKDVGAIGWHEQTESFFEIHEKDVTLNAALLLSQRLEELYPEKIIVLTRDKDIYLSLEERIILREGQELIYPDTLIFVSLHANFAPSSSKAKGIEVWYLNSDHQRQVVYDTGHVNVRYLNEALNEKYKNESRVLARKVLQGMLEVVPEAVDRGIKEETWFVVRHNSMPAILVELGFVSNYEEALLLSQKGYLRRLVEGITQGIAQFVRSYEEE